MKAAAAFAALLLASPSIAAERQTLASIEPLYRAHVVSLHPSLNPESSFRFEEVSVPGLWDALRVQLFTVDTIVRGQAIPRDPFLSWEGGIQPLARTSTTRLHSAVVLDDALYYSHSWGSGILRSHVGRLRIVDGKLEQQESEGWAFAELSLQRTGAGEIAVLLREGLPADSSGVGVLVGRIDLHERSWLRIVDAAGHEVHPRLPPDPPSAIRPFP